MITETLGMTPPKPGKSTVEGTKNQERASHTDNSGLLNVTRQGYIVTLKTVRHEMTL